jgi:hypothetical protein
LYCARHTKVKTDLTCTRCATRICPDCFVSGPVGFLCRNCAAVGQSPLFKVRPERFVLALLAGVISGAAAGLVLQHIGFFVFFIAPMIGGFLGEIVLRATGHKRGMRVEWLTGISIVAGAGLSLLISGIHILFEPMSLVFYLVSVGLVTAAAVTKIRYF